jgi:hypothetical protein
MATTRAVPANYPQPLGTSMLKADAQRQISMLRQETVTELLSILAETHEPAIRLRLIKLIENQLRSGLAAVERAEDLWPSLQDAREVILTPDRKPAVQKRHLRVYEQLDRVQRRSWELLHDSFDNVRLILDRVQAAPRLELKPGPVPAEKRRTDVAGIQQRK